MPRDPAQVLLDHLGIATDRGSFRPMLEGFRQVLNDHGIHPDRLQIPMTKPTGFRHPTLFAKVLTWCKDTGFDESFVVPHCEVDDPEPEGGSVKDFIARRERDGSLGPYMKVFKSRERYFRTDLTQSTCGFDVLETLREQGKVDYCAMGLSVPGSDFVQPMSLAAERPFPDDLQARLDALKPVLALAIYGAYRTSQAIQVARSYIGPTTGPRVLNGDISRGSTHTIEAGIMFCDVRGFTSLSERLGAEAVVPVMNRLFEVIGEEAEARDGEILKFIGDALLVVYALGERTPADVAHAMVETVRAAVERVREVAEELALPVAAGFGCHIGEVVYGNIGTMDRLDFTVMGPAVNLSSRLESLCKVVDRPAVFSEAIARHVEGLRPGGRHAVKGITEPVPVSVLSEG